METKTITAEDVARFRAATELSDAQSLALRHRVFSDDPKKLTEQLQEVYKKRFSLPGVQAVLEDPKLKGNYQTWVSRVKNWHIAGRRSKSGRYGFYEVAAFSVANDLRAGGFTTGQVRTFLRDYWPAMRADREHRNFLVVRGMGDAVDVFRVPPGGLSDILAGFHGVTACVVCPAHIESETALRIRCFIAGEDYQPLSTSLSERVAKFMDVLKSRSEKVKA